MNKERLYEKLNDYKCASARLHEATEIQIEYDKLEAEIESI